MMRFAHCQNARVIKAKCIRPEVRNQGQVVFELFLHVLRWLAASSYPSLTKFAVCVCDKPMQNVTQLRRAMS